MFKIKKSIYALIAVIILIFVVIIIMINAGIDKTSPVISIKNKEITVKVSDKEDVLLEGVTAKDDKDGDLTKSIVVEAISDFHSNGARMGTRTVTYAVSDSSNNVAKAERTIRYSDYVPPEFHLTSDLTFYSSESNINIADKVTATDLFDGDITPLVKLLKENIVTGQGGIYYAELSVFNSAGDSSKVKLPVFIESYAANPSTPDIELKDYLIYVNSEEKKPEWKDYVKNVKKHSNTAELVPESAYGDKLVIDDSKVNMNKPGTYYVTFEYTGQNDLTAITRLVVVVR